MKLVPLLLALLALGVWSGPAAADDRACSYKAVSIVLADGSSVSIDSGKQDELLAKLVSILEQRSFEEDFDPTDVAAIQAVAKELGIDLDAATASQLADALGKEVGRPNALDVLKEGLPGVPGGGDLGPATKESLTGSLVRPAAPADDAPGTMRDWSLYADGDGGDGDPGEWEPYPGDASGGSPGDGTDAPLADPSPPPLVPADPVTPPDPDTGGPTDPSGPNAPEPDPDPSHNAGNDWINRQVADHPVGAAIVGIIINSIRLSVGGTGNMTDPDYVSGRPAGPPTPEEIDRLETKLNDRKDPVNPDDAGQEPVDASSVPATGPGGVDPTLAHFDGEPSTDTVTVSSSGDAPGKLAIAPIDGHHDYDGAPPAGAPDQSDAPHVAP